YEKKDVPSAGELKPRIFLSEDERIWAKEQTKHLRKDSSPLIALHPFATHKAKSWPMEMWYQFASLLRQANIRYFWVGRGASLNHEEDHCSFINKTSLRELFALIHSADILVTGDSGPMHIADAVDTPVLAMFGPTCREWGFFPSASHDRILQLDMPCRPCSLHGSKICSRGRCDCILNITPEQVMNELNNMLN
ncbi:MAG: glycosyltransferase family 9 protein, partial [Mailhella sp.]